MTSKYSRSFGALAGVVCLAAAGGQALAAGGTAPVAKLAARPLPLPGSPGRVGMDYLAYDASTSRIWVPAGNTGKVDVVDAKTLAITPIEGFATLKRGERVMGPSSASVGEGFVYVGNRANSQVCAIDSKSLKLASCATLASSPDGVAYVAATHEVWVTTPRDQSLTILDVASPGAPKVKQIVKLDGEPEGYAVDTKRGRFYTNLEDKGPTLAFDVKTRKEVARWSAGCNKDGPKGISIDEERQLLMVACTDRVVSLRIKENGAKAGEVLTGEGVDNIDYVPALHTLFAASGKTSTLTLAELKADGTLTVLATAPTGAGARVVVADSSGRAFVSDSGGGQLVVVDYPKAPSKKTLNAEP